MTDEQLAQLRAAVEMQEKARKPKGLQAWADTHNTFFRAAIRLPLRELLEEVERLRVMVDALLNHCDKESGECSVCGAIVCPHKDPFHFHHDGCPSCSMEEHAAAHPPNTQI